MIAHLRGSKVRLRYSFGTRLLEEVDRMFFVQLERLRRMMSFAALGRFARRRSTRLKRADQIDETSYRIKASGFYKCPDFATVRSAGSQK